MLVGIYSSSPQSGKSTVRKLFQKSGFVYESFAKPVKENLEFILDNLHVDEYDTSRYLYGDWKDKVIPELGCTGGYLMSHYAMGMRDINEDIWLKMLLKRLNPKQNYVIDDLRFPNEYNIFDITITVTKQNAPKHDRVSSSENNLDMYSFDFTIVNDGTLEELNCKSQGIVDQINIMKGYWK